MGTKISPVNMTVAADFQELNVILLLCAGSKGNMNFTQFCCHTGKEVIIIFLLFLHKKFLVACDAELK